MDDSGALVVSLLEAVNLSALAADDGIAILTDGCASSFNHWLVMQDVPVSMADVIYIAPGDRPRRSLMFEPAAPTPPVIGPEKSRHTVPPWVAKRQRTINKRKPR